MDGKMLPDAVADVGGGDFDQRGRKDRFFESRGNVGAEMLANGGKAGGEGDGRILVAEGAAEDGDVAERGWSKDVLNADPGVEFRKLVSSEEQREAGIGMLTPQLVECVGSIARTSAKKFTRIDGEMGNVLNSKPQHGKTMRSRSGRFDMTNHFVRRNRGRDQKNLIGNEQFAGSLTDDQVAVVDGVESPAVEERV